MLKISNVVSENPDDYEIVINASGVSYRRKNHSNIDSKNNQSRSKVKATPITSPTVQIITPNPAIAATTADSSDGYNEKFYEDAIAVNTLPQLQEFVSKYSAQADLKLIRRAKIRLICRFTLIQMLLYAKKQKFIDGMKKIPDELPSFPGFPIYAVYFDKSYELYSEINKKYFVEDIILPKNKGIRIINVLKSMLAQD